MDDSKSPKINPHPLFLAVESQGRWPACSFAPSSLSLCPECRMDESEIPFKVTWKHVDMKPDEGYKGEREVAPTLAPTLPAIAILLAWEP